MSYSRRVVKRRSPSLTEKEWLEVFERGKLPCPDFVPRDGYDGGRVAVPEVKCPFCREMHSPLEVEACMVLPKKGATAAASESSTLSAGAAGPLSTHCEIWAFLTLTLWPDGTRRQTGKLTLSCDQDLLGLSLQDVESGQYAFMQGRCLTALLEEVELRLADGSLPWRASKYGQGRRKT